MLQLTDAVQEDDTEIEELLAAAEAMPLTQPEDGAAGAASHPAAVTASQVTSSATSARSFKGVRVTNQGGFKTRDSSMPLLLHATP